MFYLGLILSLEEEGLAAKWLIIIGIAIILISIITECALFFLQGGMNLGVRLDFPSMVWYFGLFLIFIGILLFVKNILLPPSEKRKVEENFKVKLLIFLGVLCLIFTIVARFFLMSLGGIMCYSCYVSFTRLSMLVGALFILTGIFMSFKYAMGLMLSILWPFKKRH